MSTDQTQILLVKPNEVVDVELIGMNPTSIDLVDPSGKVLPIYYGISTTNNICTFTIPDLPESLSSVHQYPDFDTELIVRFKDGVQANIDKAILIEPPIGYASLIFDTDVTQTTQSAIPPSFDVNTPIQGGMQLLYKPNLHTVNTDNTQTNQQTGSWTYTAYLVYGWGVQAFDISSDPTIMGISAQPGELVNVDVDGMYPSSIEIEDGSGKLLVIDSGISTSNGMTSFEIPKLPVSLDNLRHYPKFNKDLVIRFKDGNRADIESVIRILPPDGYSAIEFNDAVFQDDRSALPPSFDPSNEIQPGMQLLYKSELHTVNADNTQMLSAPGEWTYPTHIVTDWGAIGFDISSESTTLERYVYGRHLNITDTVYGHYENVTVNPFKNAVRWRLDLCCRINESGIITLLSSTNSHNSNKIGFSVNGLVVESANQGDIIFDGTRVDNEINLITLRYDESRIGSEYSISHNGNVSYMPSNHASSDWSDTLNYFGGANSNIDVSYLRIQTATSPSDRLQIVHLYDANYVRSNTGDSYVSYEDAELDSSIADVNYTTTLYDQVGGADITVRDANTSNAVDNWTNIVGTIVINGSDDVNKFSFQAGDVLNVSVVGTELSSIEIQQDKKVIRYGPTDYTVTDKIYNVPIPALPIVLDGVEDIPHFDRDATLRVYDTNNQPIETTIRLVPPPGYESVIFDSNITQNSSSAITQTFDPSYPLESGMQLLFKPEYHTVYPDNTHSDHAVGPWKYSAYIIYDWGIQAFEISTRTFVFVNIDAGDDGEMHYGEVGTLSSSNTTVENGTIASYLWEQVGPQNYTASIEDPTAASTDFTVPELAEPTVFTFKLTIVDSDAHVYTDTVDYNVRMLPTVTADPGDSTSTAVGEVVVLDGSRSSIENGYIVSYLWEQDDPQMPVIDIDDPTSSITSFIAPEIDSDTIFTIKLTVVDNEGMQHTAKVLHEVFIPPTVVIDAGKGRSLTESATGTLDGTGTTVTGGSIVSYKWEQIEPSNNPAVVFDPTLSKTTFIAPDVDSDTVFAFSLTAIDNRGYEHIDTVIFIVTASVLTYIHEQDVLSKIWTINHDLDKTLPIVDVWIEDNGDITKVAPAKHEVVDSSTCRVHFTEDVIGYAVVV